MELLGLKAYADLQNADKDTPSSAVIIISQLYEIVKTYDKKTNAVGRSVREAEIEVQNKFLKKKTFQRYFKLHI